MSTIEVICTEGACQALPPEVVADTVGAVFLARETPEGYVINGDDFIRGLESGRHTVALDYHRPLHARSRLIIGHARCQVIT